MLKTNKVYYIILFFLFLFHSICNYFWLSPNQMSPIWDEGGHLLAVLKYKDFFLRFPALDFNSFAEIGGYYPPLFHISALFLSFVWGNSIRTMVMVNIIYMAIMLFSTFKIGELIFDRKAGLLAAFILSMFPIIFGTSRMFLLDYALTTIVTLSIYFLLLTDYFKNTKYSLFFGISLGLGMLTKNTYGIFIIGPLIYIFCKALLFNDSKGRTKRQVINLFYSLSLGGVLSIPWYILSFGFAEWKTLPILRRVLYPVLLKSHYFLFIVVSLMLLFIIVKIHKTNLFAKIRMKWWLLFSSFLFAFALFVNWQALLVSIWYLVVLKDQIGLFFSIVFVYFFVKFLNSRAKNKHILTLWIFIPSYLVSFFLRMDIRYTMPYLPVMAIVIAAGLLQVRRALPSALFFSLISLFCLVQFFLLSFILYYDSSNIYFENQFNRYVVGHNPSNYWLIHPPIKGKWNIEEILRWIKDESAGCKVTIGILVNTAYLNEQVFRYYIYLNRLPFNIVSCTEYNKEYAEYFKSDYLLTLENLKLEQWPWVLNRMNMLNSELERNSDRYIKAKELELPPYWDIGRENKVIIYAEKKD